MGNDPENLFVKLLRKSCVKCGFSPPPGRTQCIEYRITEPFMQDEVALEVLKITCYRCGYSWEMDPKDKMTE